MTMERLHGTTSALRRLHERRPHIMHLFDRVPELRRPRAIGTSPALWGASTRNTRQVSKSVYEDGHSRESNELEAYGGIVIWDLFRPGAPRNGRQLSWKQGSGGGETLQVVQLVHLVPYFLTLGLTQSTEDGIGVTTPIVGQLEQLQGKIQLISR